jgi:CubicO group peptidase (beta-lactamase class C family)
VTAGDGYHIGSVTKAISATVVAALVDRGLMTFDTPPAAVLDAADVHPALRDVGAGRFLTHRSGMAGYTEDEDWEPFTGWTGSPTELRARFAAHVLAEEPAGPVGEMLYSNAAFTVAAAMAERITGEVWEDLVRDTVLRPLGMQSAGTGWPDGPVGHWERGGALVADTPPPLDAMIGPAGDMHMHVTDLATFGRAHLNALAGRGVDTVASAATIRAFYAELGFVLGQSRRAGFAGSAGTFTALLVIEPSENRAVALATNVGDEANGLFAQAYPAVVGALSGSVEEVSD